MKKIVGIKIKGHIYTGLKALQVAQIMGDYEELVCKKRALLMQACDVGPFWNELPNKPVLFIESDDGNIEPGPEFKKYWKKQ